MYSDDRHRTHIFVAMYTIFSIYDTSNIQPSVCNIYHIGSFFVQPPYIYATPIYGNNRHRIHIRSLIFIKFHIQDTSRHTHICYKNKLYQFRLKYRSIYFLGYISLMRIIVFFSLNTKGYVTHLL